MFIKNLNRIFEINNLSYLYTKLYIKRYFSSMIIEFLCMCVVLFCVFFYVFKISFIDSILFSITSKAIFLYHIKFILMHSPGLFNNYDEIKFLGQNISKIEYFNIFKSIQINIFYLIIYAAGLVIFDYNFSKVIFLVCFMIILSILISLIFSILLIYSEKTYSLIGLYNILTIAFSGIYIIDKKSNYLFYSIFYPKIYYQEINFIHCSFFVIFFLITLFLLYLKSKMQKKILIALER